MGGMKLISNNIWWCHTFQCNQALTCFSKSIVSWQSSLFQRFVSSEFDSNQSTTAKKSEYFPSLFLNDNLYELKIIDLPCIPFFPPNNVVEWTDYRFYGLRSASAYIMVYDASTPSTFQLVKSLRDQMYESRDMTNIPVVVAANKMDVVASSSIGRLSNHGKMAYINSDHSWARGVEVGGRTPTIKQNFGPLPH